MDDHLRLRPLRIFDGSFMSKGLRSADILEANGLNRPISGSLFKVWWWLRKTYAVLYCIEVDSRCIGFLGLCNMDPGRSAEASLVIFNRADRHLGHGTRAFTVLLEGIRRYPLIKKIFVRVKVDNRAALSFWTKLGFREVETTEGTRLMEKVVEMKSVMAVTGH